MNTYSIVREFETELKSLLEGIREIFIERFILEILRLWVFSICYLLSLFFYFLEPGFLNFQN